MKSWLTTLVLVCSLNSFAEPNTVTDEEVIAAAKNDSIARAAFEQASGRYCKTVVAHKPSAPYEKFKVVLQCTQPNDSYVGGGIYLTITIEGQYWGHGAVDVQKIEIHRAG